MEGQLIEYDIATGKKLSQNNYINDEEVGMQKYFYPSGNLQVEYEKDKSSAFINNYVVYSPKGKIIFKSALEKNGTGYIKFYDKDNNIEWEGAFVNKRKQGWHKQYLINADDKKIRETDKILYKDDDILIETKVFNEPEMNPELNSKIDSVVSIFAYNNPVKVLYYSKGKIIKRQKIRN